MSSTFTPTEEQRAIADDLKQPGNKGIDAGAGTGKTSTLLYLVRDVLPRGGILMCVFNRNNKIDIESKLKAAGFTFKDASAKTFDGLAFSMFKEKYPRFAQSEPDTHKYSTLARWWIRRNLPPTHTPHMRKSATKFLERLFHFWVCNTTRDHNTGAVKLFVGGSLENPTASLFAHDLSNAYVIAERYSLDLDYDESGDPERTLIEVIEADYRALIEKALPELIRLGRLAFHDPQSVASVLVDEDGDPLYEGLASGKVWASFQDMSYYAVVEGWKPWQSKIVMVDEAQDLSPLQRALVNAHILPRNGRVIIVGDPQQAIQGWNGADNDGFMNSQIFWGIKSVKPLSVCWRCCRSVVELASNWKPGFTAAPNAIEGVIANMHDSDVVKYAKDGDAIISRLRSQLVVWWRKMVKANIPARIIGQDPSEIVIRLLEKIADQKGFDFKKLKQHVNEYEKVQIERMQSRKRPESEILSLQDEIETVRAMIEDVEAPTLEALIAKIRDELDPKKMPSGGVVILTGHTAKGMEYEQVFCVTPEKFPLTYRDQPDEEFTQECNLEYVMQTRAKKALFFVSKEYAHYDPNAPVTKTELMKRDDFHPSDLPLTLEDDEDFDDEDDFEDDDELDMSPALPAAVMRYRGLNSDQGEIAPQKAETPLLPMDALPDGEPEPVLLTFSPMGEKSETPLLPIDDEQPAPAAPAPVEEPRLKLGTAVTYNKEPGRVVQITSLINVEYLHQPHNPPYRWVNTEDVELRQRPALPTEPILLVGTRATNWMNRDMVLLTEDGATDNGAFDRAVMVARDLISMDIWDGYSPIRIADPYGVYDRLEENRYVSVSIEQGELLVRRAEAPAPAEPETTPEPAPFRATGNLAADMSAKKAQAKDKLYKIFGKLPLKDIEDLHELLGEIREEKRAELEHA